ncbi:glycosyltransferase [Botrimarina hoheduenensis]|uniref:Putative glycosyltransferase EpsE n=1 Tax=Botrimarina hoheduenensis TaxID=2528000 RepID=A0A5C5W7D9_9BACT|nr:glycosyltransferase [Botrimarina hoheduenensis]TWT46788.1 putative glycosyltransferase EpsE [Botrimarina hoheduenensis]
MPSPAISFVIPVHNAGVYLRSALASLRWQSHEAWEAVCVNDGSTDESLAVLQDFAAADPRFRVVDQPNRGIVAALNRGLTEARGEWIARMDADDLATPDRLARQWQVVQRNPELIAVGSNVLVVDPEGEPIRTTRYPTDHAAIEAGLLAGRETLAHPTLLYRRRAALSVGAYRPEFEWVEDTDLWLRMIAVGRFANVAAPLLRYRLHEKSVCWNRRATQRERLAALLRRAHADRGLEAPASLRAPKRGTPSPAAGKWARQAARAGHYPTALKQWRRLVGANPLSLVTARVSAELAYRAATSLLSQREPSPPTLPDWHEWDCQLAGHPRRVAA